MTGLDRLRGWFTETRASDTDYTAVALAAIQAASSGVAGVRGLDVYQGALNLIENAASSATLEGEFADVLLPHLGAIARGLTDCGEATYELQVDGAGRLVLLPAVITAVTGTASPAGWVYTLMRSGPSEQTVVTRPAAGVVSFRAHSDPRTPYRGRGAIARGNSGALLAAIETQFGAEARFKPARAVSAGVSKEQRTGVTEAIAKGGVVTISGGHMSGRDQAGALQTGVIRGEYTAPAVALHSDLTRLVAGAMGLPAGLLLSDGDGASARESFRRFAAVTVSPLLGIVAREWAAKVGPMSFNLDALRASDETARARALGSRAQAVSKLVASGVSLDEALSLAGVD